MSRTISDHVLEGAIALFKTPGTWKQGSCAFRDNDPYGGVQEGDDDADGFCIHGALFHVARQLIPDREAANRIADDAVERILAYMKWSSTGDIHHFNDRGFGLDEHDVGERTTVQQVITLLQATLGQTTATIPA